MYHVIAQPNCLLHRLSSYALADLQREIKRGEKTCPLKQIIAEFDSETVGKGANETAVKIFKRHRRIKCELCGGTAEYYDFRINPEGDLGTVDVLT